MTDISHTIVTPGNYAIPLELVGGPADGEKFSLQPSDYYVALEVKYEEGPKTNLCIMLMIADDMNRAMFENNRLLGRYRRTSVQTPEGRIICNYVDDGRMQ